MLGYRIVKIGEERIPAHDWNMPHDTMVTIAGDPNGCPPGCPYRRWYIENETEHAAEVVGRTYMEVMRARVNALTTAKGWRVSAHGDTDGYEFAAYVALLHSEASEALEAYRIKEWSETRADGKPLGVGPELADVFIRLVDMADIWNINLDYEIERVLAYGWTRPYQHGGKTL
jgi:NTP pyrophosphatase (non-canonical NTP hydrolase)